MLRCVLTLKCISIHQSIRVNHQFISDSINRMTGWLILGWWMRGLLCKRHWTCFDMIIVEGKSCIQIVAVMEVWALCLAKRQAAKTHLRGVLSPIPVESKRVTELRVFLMSLSRTKDNKVVFNITAESESETIRTELVLCEIRPESHVTANGVHNDRI